MLLVLGTFSIPPENLPSARQIIETMIEASRAEDGCEEYSYAEDLLIPGLIHVKELWNSKRALNLHFATDHLAVWRAAWTALGIGNRNLRIYEVGEASPT